MAGTQVPSTFDAGGDLTPVSPETVQPSLKDRILGGAGKVVQSASGQDPTADSPLSQAIAKHHKQQADEANMHQQNTARYYAGHLMVRQGINPETQQRFDDPTYKGPSQADMDAKYTNFYNSSYQHYLKAAGLNKELKEAITKQGDLMNHVSTVVTQKSNAQNAATNAAKGGIQPPPGSGSSPAAPGTTTGSAPIIGGAGGDSGAPAAAAPGGLTPPPKSDTPPAAQASPPAPAAKGNSQVPAPPTPPADDDFSTLSHMSGIAGSVQGRSNARAQAIAEEGRQDKRDLEQYKAKTKVLYDAKTEEDVAKAKALAANPHIARFSKIAAGNQLPDDAVDTRGDIIPDSKRSPEHVYQTYDGGQHFLEVSDDYERKKVGNEYRVYRKHDPTDLGTVVSGPVDLGKTSDRTEPGVDANGNFAVLHKTSTSKPITAAPTSSSPAPVGGANPPTQTSSPSSATPKTGGGSAASPTSFKAGSSAGGTGGGKAPVFSPGQYNTFRKVATPLMEASTQIFGDPSDPNYKSLESYADIADDPKESAALAVAVRRSIAGIEEKMKGAGTGLTDLIKNQTGFTNELIASQASADRDAIGGLSPRNKEAYAAVMSALGAMIGVRAATGGSAAKFSALALEREIPIPGVNSFSKAQFNKQLNGIAGEIKRGAHGIPVITDDERKFINANQSRTGIAAADRAAGGDMVTVQIPGYPAKPILRSKLDAFQKKYPNGKVIQ